MSKVENPQAFPEQTHKYARRDNTLRDYFAGQAMTGIISNPESPMPDFERCAEHAYNIADAMLEERAK